LGNGIVVALVDVDSIAFPWKAIEMPMKPQTAFGIGSRSVAALACVPPRGNSSALGPIGTAFLRVQQFLEALKGTLRSPQEPPDEEDHPANDSIWNDPVFWMMWMH
jgi:hypothetical protein